MTDEQLSDHFWLREFCQSETATRMRLTIEPSPAVVANLRRLCLSILEPIRILLGRPMVITSGYRPVWLNDMIRGAKNSAHLEGRAADVKVVGMSPEAFCRWIKREAMFPVDQCILEFGAWTHLSHAAAPRNQYLVAKHVGADITYEALV